jgi:uncharacterized protein YbjT (DUF2867 family)
MAGHDVVCCGRDEGRLRQLFPGCSTVGGDFSRDRKPEDWLPRLQGVSVVVNAAGIIQQRAQDTFANVHRDGPIALFQAAQRAGVRRVVQISALGSDAEATTEYHRTKRAADDFLSHLSLEWVILQPSIVYGAGARSFAFFASLAALPVIPLVGRGDQRIQPVWVKDLTEAVVRLVQPVGPTQLRLAVVGPEPITLRTFLRQVRRWMGLPSTTTLPIPLGVIRLVAYLGDVLRWQFVTSATLSMLFRGNVADPSPFTKTVGIAPRAVTEALSDNPSWQSDRWHAALYLLRPLLRFSIALVWIASGVVSLLLYPREGSEALLLKSGIPAAMASAVLNLTACLDIGLGIATWLKWQLPFVVAAQLILIMMFSGIIAVALPEFWLHPFGPLLKNVPLFVATLVMLAIEQE